VVKPGSRVKAALKQLGTIMLLIISTSYAGHYAAAEETHESLFQTSILEALMEGVYDGDLTIGELKEHGDFGVGTYNRLNGEMVALDGVFYRVKSDGNIEIPQDSTKSPFAIVTFFDADETLNPDKKLSCEELKGFIENALPNKNIFYAIKVKGNFEYMKTRSVPEQSMPYPPLSEVIKLESHFEFNDIAGTIVGLWLPEYMDQINQPGFHFHFISDDKKSGGHVLDCKTNIVSIEADYMRELDLELPDTKGFNNAELTEPRKEE